jgi:hypothetical protein
MPKPPSKYPDSKPGLPGAPDQRRDRIEAAIEANRETLGRLAT